MAKTSVTVEIQEIIDKAVKKAVNEGLKAGQVQATRTVTDTYKATERRLYAIPILEQKIKKDKERLHELDTIGVPERSKSIMRFRKSGVRLSNDEIVEALKQDMLAKIAMDEYEVTMVRNAMESFKNDPYYMTVTGRYINRYDDDDIANDLNCGETQVWKQRTRIVKDIAVLLYGAVAV